MKGFGLMDMVLVMVMLLIGSIVVLTSHYFLSEFRDSVNGTLDANSTQIVTDGVGAIEAFDGAYIFITVVAFASVIVSGLFLRTHPVFFIISIFMLVMVIMFSSIFTNSYLDLASSDPLVSSGNRFPLMAEIYRYLPVLAGVFGIAAIIVWYAKRQGESSV